MHGEKKERKYGAASISIGVLEEIDKLIEELRYWPSRSAFVREACLEKIRRERQTLEELREATSRRSWEGVLEKESSCNSPKISNANKAKENRRVRGA